MFSLIGIGVWAYNELNTEPPVEPPKEKEEEKPTEKPKLKIIDEESDSRNVAVMYNNIDLVWGHEAGLQDAYIVYEILVEGGYTRFMAIFRDATTERMGSVRSARPYFLDYAFENDAVFIHFGGSEQALSDVRTLGVNNINFMNYEPGYWRDTSLKLATEHTAFTSMARINEAISNKGFASTSKVPLLLSYSIDEIDIKDKKDSKVANNVYINFSASKSTTFEYDAVKGVYLIYQSKGKGNLVAHKDGVTGEHYTAKNIITYQIPCNPTDAYGRQELNNIGGGQGYYITNGYAVPITWEKNRRTSQTVYRYLDGTKLVVNDGNTYIEIQPTGKQLTIE